MGASHGAASLPGAGGPGVAIEDERENHFTKASCHPRLEPGDRGAGGVADHGDSVAAANEKVAGLERVGSLGVIVEEGNARSHHRHTLLVANQERSRAGEGTELPDHRRASRVARAWFIAGDAPEVGGKGWPARGRLNGRERFQDALNANNAFGGIVDRHRRTGRGDQ